MADEILHYFLFEPSPLDAVGYYLPLLISGKPLPPAADALINRTDVYAREPSDLCAQFDPVPQREKTGDRFFFTPCKRLGGNRSKRTVDSGGGSWISQHTFDIHDGAGVKVGEHKTFAFKSKKEGNENDKARSFQWLMDEYRCDPCPEKTLVDGAEMVMCKIRVHVPSDAALDSEARQPKVRRGRQEAKKRPAPQPQAPISTPAAKKRPAPVAGDQPCPKNKKTRSAADPSPTPPEFTPPPLAYAPLPDSLLEAPAPASAECDMDRFVCTMDELLGVCGEGEVDEAEIEQYMTTLEEALCGAREEEAEPEQQQQQPPPPPFKTDELNDVSDELPENYFPLIDDPREVNDFSFFPISSEDIFGGGEILQQQQHQQQQQQEEEAFSASKKLMVRCNARTMFTPDQLEGHREFMSYA